jgi:hypothetical protein
MKTIFFLVVSTILFSCCKKKENTPYKGEVSFLMNGKNYSGTLTAGGNDSTFSFSLFNEKNNINQDNFTFDFVRKNSMKQRIDKRVVFNFVPNFAECSYGTSQDDGDVVCELFNTSKVDSTTNFIQITKQENNYKEVWGDFNVTLYKTESCPEKNSGDTLRCTNGKFHLLLE